VLFLLAIVLSVFLPYTGDRQTFEVMTSTYPRGTLGSVDSLLAAILYQGNDDGNNKLWNIGSTEDRYGVFVSQTTTEVTVTEYLCHK
jgi:hypothetical protein